MHTFIKSDVPHLVASNIPHTDVASSEYPVVQLSALHCFVFVLDLVLSEEHLMGLPGFPNAG
jgi:hypothetical protein